MLNCLLEKEKAFFGNVHNNGVIECLPFYFDLMTRKEKSAMLVLYIDWGLRVVSTNLKGFRKQLDAMEIK